MQMYENNQKKKLSYKIVRLSRQIAGEEKPKEWRLQLGQGRETKPSSRPPGRRRKRAWVRDRATAGPAGGQASEVTAPSPTTGSFIFLCL